MGPEIVTASKVKAVHLKGGCCKFKNKGRAEHAGPGAKRKQEGFFGCVPRPPKGGGKAKNAGLRSE